MKIYHDSGNAYDKSLNASGAKCLLLPIVGEVQSTGFQLQNSKSLEISVNGQNYLVGNDARLNSSLAYREQGRERVLTDQYKVSLLAAISELTKSTNVEIELTTGLPYKDWKYGNLKSQLKAFLPGEYRIQRQGFKSQRIKISHDLKILPQNLGAIFYHFMNGDGTFKRPDIEVETLTIGLVNIGSHTVEFGTVTIDQNLNFNVVETQSKSEPEGIWKAVDVLRDYCLKAFPDQVFDDYELVTTLRTGTLWTGSQQDLKPLVNQVLDTQAEKLKALIRQNWSEQYNLTSLNKLHTLILTGGGACLLGSRLSGLVENVLKSEDPQWDTVEGYRKFAKALKK